MTDTTTKKAPDVPPCKESYKNVPAEPASCTKSPKFNWRDWPSHNRFFCRGYLLWFHHLSRVASW